VKVRETRILTEEDYGAFVQVFTLYLHEGRPVVRFQAGYREPSEEAWYELDAEPTTFPTKDTTDVLVNCYTDQTRDLEDFFGVTGHKLDGTPDGLSV